MALVLDTNGVVHEARATQPRMVSHVDPSSLQRIRLINHVGGLQTILNHIAGEHVHLPSTPNCKFSLVYDSDYATLVRQGEFVSPSDFFTKTVFRGDRGLFIVEQTVDRGVKRKRAYAMDVTASTKCDPIPLKWISDEVRGVAGVSHITAYHYPAKSERS